MKWYWKILVGLGFLLALVVIVDIGLNLWVKFQLPKIINKGSDSAYSITYKDIKISLWNNSIHARGIIIIPRAALADSTNKAGIYAKIEAVKVENFKIRDMLFNDKIKAKSITVERPKVILYKKKEQYDVSKKFVRPFDKIISVSDIILNHGNFEILAVENNVSIFSAQNINVKLDGLLITEKILAEAIPFQFKDYAFSCDSIYYNPNSFYHIKTKKIQASKAELTINNFGMVPEYSRREFVTKIPKEKDLYTLLCKSITASEIDWGIKEGDFFLHCNAVDVNQAAANIYRSKAPADDLSKKHLYNKLLRDLKFDLKLDTLKVRNSIIEYEEEKSVGRGSGKVSFNRLTMTATSICSGFKKAELPDTRIKVNCHFMNSSPLYVNWRFNVMDKADGFKIKGTLRNLDVEKMASFSKPYMNVTAKGIIDELHFDFTGNDKKNSGQFGVEYDDLKFTVYRKKDPEKKNKLLTLVSRIFVKKDTKEKVKEAYVKVERIPEKSFYNLLWRSVADGLKQIII